MAKSNTAEIIQMARQLGTLEERRKQLAESLKRLDDDIKTLRLKLEGPRPTGGEGASGDLVDAILQCMVTSPNKEFSAEEITGLTGKNAASVRGALSRLLREGRVTRPKRGLYMARAEGA